MPACRGHPRDVLVGVFVAVLRDVLAVEAVEISEDREHGRQPVPHQEPACAAGRRSRAPCRFGRHHLSRFGDHLLRVICFRHWLSPSHGEVRWL